MGTWVDMSDGRTPIGSIIGGKDSSGEKIYVARAIHDEGTLPAKLIPSHHCAYVSSDGEEHRKTEYQVLVGGSYHWVKASGSDIPDDAFFGGSTRDRDILYIGRVHHQGSLTVGKVHPAHGVCYIPFDGKEHSYNEYEILVANAD